MEHQIFRLAKMILPDWCSTSHDLASLFHGGRNTLEAWTGKSAKRIGTRPSATHSTFEEVLQVCFVFDAVKREKGKSHSLLRFGCCQVLTLRMPRRIASFSSLQVDR